MRKKRSNGRGFTLVEVIVVLVVLAILAAIMIPAMTGWIDRARQRRLVVGCRTCVTAAQTLASEQYGLLGAGNVNVTPGAVMDLARINGSVVGVSITEANASVETLSYAEGADLVTYFRDPTPHYVFGTGGIGYDGNNWSSLINDAFLAALTNAGASGYRAVDSNAPGAGFEPKKPAEFGGWTGKTMTEIANLLTGGDSDKAKEALEDANIKTWSLRMGASNTNPTVFLTDQDITGKNVNDQVRALRYDINKNEYYVGYAKVYEKSIESKTGDIVKYKVLGTSGPTAGYFAPSGASYGDYAAALTALSTLPEKP